MSVNTGDSRSESGPAALRGFCLLNQSWNPKPMCESKYPPVPCKVKVNDEEWWQMGPHRCAKAYFKVPHLSFDEAQRTCERASHGKGNLRGYLVTIRNSEELNQAVCIMYREHTGKPHYWIGLRAILDLVGDSKYGWVDGSTFSFSRWAPDQPDDLMYGEDCIEMNYWEWALWNDESCDVKRPYMCAVNLY
ncbi:C-type isolectin Sp-CL4-like [Enoplosus armatus]|uniref:C-type isolectin Sp-CL4-like n=1 Tax=Enoplosus armatus TaxID=215367 RepID=UPI003993A43F